MGAWQHKSSGRSRSGLPRYVWTHDVGTGVHGGTKATVDVYRILEAEGWIPYDTTRREGIAGLFDVLRHLAGLLFLNRKSTFFVQLPAYGSANILVLKFILRRFNTVVLVHDIDSLRGVTAGGSGEYLIERASSVITTGHLLRASKLETDIERTSRLDAWDYLVAPDFQPPVWEAYGKIIFAGTLSVWKNGGLFFCAHPRPGLHLYGTRYIPERNRSTKDVYHGPFDAERPVFSGPIGWGLLWEGKKESTSDAPENDYERFNQPHKLSLYLACGLPVIAWREAAVAAFIQREGCGVLIDSLEEIDTVLRRTNEKARLQMRARALALGEDVRSGQFLKKSLMELGLARERMPEASAMLSAGSRAAGAVS
jgi:hypothetical protein